MKNKKKIFCHLDILRFFNEEIFLRETGNSKVISITNGRKLETMIFIGRDSSNTCYEVQVYKNKATDKYKPHLLDNVKRYEENDEYASFIFDKFYFAREFVDMISIRHKEYRERPVRKIEM